MAVRREKVILELEDNFTTGMARAAAAAALLKRELNDLSGTAVKGAARDLDKTAVSAEKASSSIDKTGNSADTSGKQIDRFSGRLRLFADAAMTIGPALIPIGAAMIPALAGLTAGFATAAGAAGVAVLAFNGVGDALKALDAYQLEPTTANLEKMQVEMDKLGPAGADFARYLDSIEPELRSLQLAAREGMFPGVEEGIDNLLEILPQVRTIVASLAAEMGDLAASAGKGLSGEGFASFFRYLETDAAPTLEAFGHTIGNVAEGFANLMVAFAPLTRDFSSGMESMSQSFADWAAGLAQTQGFRDFVDYVRESGPQVAEFLGAMSTAFVGIIKAAAPVGQTVLPILTNLAKVLGALANSPIGGPLFTAAAGLIAFNRAASLFKAGGALAKLPGLAKTAGTGLSTLVDDFTLLGTTAMTAGAKSEREMARIEASTRRANMAMSSVGKGVSFAAILTGIGLVNAAFDDLRDNIETTDLSRNLEALARGADISDFQDLGQNIADVYSNVTYAYDKASDIMTFGLDTSELERSQQEIEKVDQALAAMVEGGQADTAAAAFKQIQKQAAGSGVSAEDAAKAFDAYQTALANNAPTADEAAAAERRAAAATTAAGNAADLTRSKITGLMNAMKEQRQEALAAFDAETAYAQAIAEARKQAAKSNAGIDLSAAKTKKQREEISANRGALSQLAGAWNNQGSAVKNNIGKFAEARAQFIKTAHDMGVPTAAAEKLADKLMEIPRTVTTKVTAITGTALAALAEARRQLQAMDGLTATTYLRTIRSGPGGTADNSFHYASGGYTGPGGKYEPAGIVHRGEVVIPQELVKRDWSMLKSRYGDLPGFAAGGFVQPQRMAPSRQSSSTVVVSPQSLVGLRIEGRMDVTTGNIRGVVREEIAAERRFDRDHRRG